MNPVPDDLLSLAKSSFSLRAFPLNVSFRNASQFENQVLMRPSERCVLLLHDDALIKPLFVDDRFSRSHSLHVFPSSIRPLTSVRPAVISFSPSCGGRLLPELLWDKRFYTVTKRFLSTFFSVPLFLIRAKESLGAAHACSTTPSFFNSPSTRKCSNISPSSRSAKSSSLFADQAHSCLQYGCRAEWHLFLIFHSLPFYAVHRSRFFFFFFERLARRKRLRLLVISFLCAVRISARLPRNNSVAISGGDHGKCLASESPFSFRNGDVESPGFFPS